MVGSAMLFVVAVVGIAALSHCPRRIRMWPALLLATSALVMSDRSLILVDEIAPLAGVRWLLAIAMLGSAAGTIAVMAHTITSMCPMCQKRAPRTPAPARYKLARPLIFSRDEHKDTGP